MPKAQLPLPVMLRCMVLNPTAVFVVPVVLFSPVNDPIAIFAEPVFALSARLPIAMFEFPEMF